MKELILKVVDEGDFFEISDPRALEAARIVFTGPNPGAIAAMGDKIESKKAAAKAHASAVSDTLASSRTPSTQ
jgi:propionyl-CoA carboxylase alpha chain